MNLSAENVFLNALPFFVQPSLSSDHKSSQQKKNIENRKKQAPVIGVVVS